MGARLRGPARDQSRAGDAAHQRLRPDRADARQAGLCPHRACLRRPDALAGEPDGPPVVPGSTSLADYISGIWGALGVMMALRVKERTGGGQFIDIALYESVFRLLDELAPAYAKTGYVRERMGADTVNVAPHSHYRTARASGWRSPAPATRCSSAWPRRWAAGAGRGCRSSPPARPAWRARDEVNAHGGALGRKPAVAGGARQMRGRRGALRAHLRHRRHLRGCAISGAGEPAGGGRSQGRAAGAARSGAAAVGDARRAGMRGPRSGRTPPRCWAACSASTPMRLPICRRRE